MEDGEEITPSSEEVRWLTFAELADEMCPVYMAMGIPYLEYWYGDYTQLAHYRKAHEIRCDQINYNAWLQGAYLYDALCAVSPVLNAFAKRGTKPAPYLKEPYSTAAQENRKQKVDAKVGAAKFQAIASRLNQTLKRNERL